MVLASKSIFTDWSNAIPHLTPSASIVEFLILIFSAPTAAYIFLLSIYCRFWSDIYSFTYDFAFILQFSILRLIPPIHPDVAAKISISIFFSIKLFPLHLMPPPIFSLFPDSITIFAAFSPTKDAGPSCSIINAAPSLFFILTVPFTTIFIPSI